MGKVSYNIAIYESNLSSYLVARSVSVNRMRGRYISRILDFWELFISYFVCGFTFCLALKIRIKIKQ